MNGPPAALHVPLLLLVCSLNVDFSVEAQWILLNIIQSPLRSYILSFYCTHHIKTQRAIPFGHDSDGRPLIWTLSGFDYTRIKSGYVFGLWEETKLEREKLLKIPRKKTEFKLIAALKSNSDYVTSTIFLKLHFFCPGSQWFEWKYSEMQFKAKFSIVHR